MIIRAKTRPDEWLWVNRALFVFLCGFIAFLHFYILSQYQHLIPSLLYFIVPAFLASLYVVILSPLVIFWAGKWGVVDKPDARKRHDQAVPLMGGLIVYIAFVSVYLLYNHWSVQTKSIMVGATIVMLLGSVDDIYPLSSTTRLIGQSAAALVVMSAGLVVSFMPDTFWGNLLAVAITYVWILGIVNATNFVDGVDGLAAGFTAIAAMFFLVITLHLQQFYVTLMTSILVGSCLGFLMFNFKPARIYLGDGGSTFLGFMLACFALYGEWSTRGPVIALGIPVLILGVLIFDMVYITISRVRNGHVRTFRQWLDYTGRDHFHHRLLNLGFKEHQAVIFIYLTSIILGISALLMEHARVSYPVILAMVQAVLIFMLISILMLMGRKVSGG